MATARSKPLRPSRGPLAATSSTHHGQQEHGYVSATVLFTPQKTQGGWKHFLPIKLVKAGAWYVHMACTGNNSATSMPRPTGSFHLLLSSLQSTPTGFKRTDTNAQSQKISFK